MRATKASVVIAYFELLDISTITLTEVYTCIISAVHVSCWQLRKEFSCCSQASFMQGCKR